MTILKYTGREALEMIQTHFPSDWQIRLDDAKANIRRYMRLFKCNSKNAYSKFLQNTDHSESKIVHLAALQSILDETAHIPKTRNELIEDLRYKIKEIHNQMSSLEFSKTTDRSDKQILKSYYNDKIREFESQLSVLINSFQVVDAEILTINLFTASNQNI